MRRIPLAAMLMLLALFSIENRCLAQAFVEHVFPPCVARGRVTRIELVGSHLQTAHALWTTLPGDKLKTTPAGESRSGHLLFDVELANEAPLGLYGLRVATDDGSRGHHGFVTDVLKEVLAETGEARIVCCGPEPMMAAVAEIACAANVPCQVSLETPMACGIGICFTCVAKVRDAEGNWDYKRTCVDGPVFDAAEIEW